MQQAVKLLQVRTDQGKTLAPQMVLTQVSSSSVDNNELKKQISKVATDIKMTNAAVAVISKQVIGLRRGNVHALSNSDSKGGTFASPRNKSPDAKDVKEGSKEKDKQPDDALPADTDLEKNEELKCRLMALLS